MWQELGVALALLLIVEGILPFINPAGMRRMLEAMTRLSDSQWRFAGLSSMLLGLILLYILRH
jgi:uncharacterized protein YjeT (DUF2065 family)